MTREGKGNVYFTAALRVSDGIRPGVAWAPSVWWSKLTPDGHNAIVIGSGGALVAEAAAASGLAIETTLPAIEPHARFLAQLAVDRLPTETVSPLYLRAPDVKPQPEPIARRP